MQKQYYREAISEQIIFFQRYYFLVLNLLIIKAVKTVFNKTPLTNFSI